jgi:uncharacterized protein (DUF1778 family)
MRMNVNVRLRKDAETLLEHAAMLSGKPKNAIINEAILLYAKAFNHAQLQQEINHKMSLLNQADSLDNTTDLGDFD